MFSLLLKALAAWFVLVALAILNGLARDKLIAPALGPGAALPLSGLTLSALILIATYLMYPFLGLTSVARCLTVGGLWVACTLAFEFVFGHFVMGKPWGELSEVLKVHRGNLFLLTVLAAFVVPYVAARLRGGLG